MLQIDPGTDEKKIKKQFRKLSILVHPDKNPTDQERAELAFEAVNTANQTLFVQTFLFSFRTTLGI